MTPGCCCHVNDFIKSDSIYLGVMDLGVLGLPVESLQIDAH